MIQDDGKILVGGSFDAVNGETRGCLARLNADGGLDSTFYDRITRLHGNGTLDSTFGASIPMADGTVNAALVQDDGKILIGGAFSTVNWEPRPALARLRPADGRLDFKFCAGYGGPRMAG